MSAFADRIFAIWLSGGWVMVPLFGLAVLLYAQAYALYRSMRRLDLEKSSEANFWDWVRSPENAVGRAAEIIRFTQADASSAKQVRNRFEEIRLATVGSVERRSKFVSTLVAVAPLMGLLGTVMGMLQTFFGISSSGGAETAGIVASGISEALVTTQAGLTIALPGLFVVMLIRRRIHVAEARLARLECLTLSHLRLI